MVPLFLGGHDGRRGLSRKRLRLDQDLRARSREPLTTQSAGAYTEHGASRCAMGRKPSLFNEKNAPPTIQKSSPAFDWATGDPEDTTPSQNNRGLQFNFGNFPS